MRRRRFLAAAAGAALAGCSAPLATGDESTRTPDVDPAPIARRGLPGDICETEPLDRPGIYAIDEPATAPDWSAIDPEPSYAGGLDADSTVIGLERDGRTRAYPLEVLGIHEIVNDEFGGPLVVTYCPICRSGMVASRRIDGDVVRFEVSGQLWTPPELRSRVSEDDGRVFGVEPRSGETIQVRNGGNLVMVDDRTGSYWSQMLARAICGPFRGRDLDIRPSAVATWDEWQSAHPDTDVLLPPPHSGTVRE